MSHLDFAPTFLKVAGATVPAVITGRSLLPLLPTRSVVRVGPARNRASTVLDRLTWCRPDGGTYLMRAVRTAEYL
ncbi:MAG: hypothetical protein CK548_04320 [Opitutia bacterium]|nr:hypothetical protein [Opitutaceae bacterium]PHX72395.1 MAG: hypothetical protein CK548_04320 [Opitutae bacterium]